MIITFPSDNVNSSHFQKTVHVYFLDSDLRYECCNSIGQTLYTFSESQEPEEFRNNT